MSEYTGTRLKVELTDGTLLQGVVCSIDQHTSVLHLKEVVIRLPDGNLRGAPELKVQGTQIKDLSVVEAAAPKQNEPSPAKPMPEQRKQQQLQQQQQPQQSQPSRQPTQAERKPEPSGFVDPAIVSMSAQSSPAPQSAAPVTTKQQQQQQQQQPKPKLNVTKVSDSTTLDKPNEIATPSALAKPVLPSPPQQTKKRERKPIKSLLFTAATQPSDFVETEVLNYEDLFDSQPKHKSMSPQREKKSNGKSDTKKQERNGKSKETKDSKEKPKAKEPKKAKQTKSESPTSKPDEAVLDQAATNTLTSMLQISPAQAKSAADISSEGSSPVSTQSSRKGSQGTFKVPSNLIPPMARGRAASSDTISTSSTRSSKDKLDLESQKEAKQLNKSPSPKQHTPKQEHKEEPKQQPKETKETKPATVSAKELDALVHPTSPLNIPDSNHEQDEDVEDGMPRIKVVSNGMRCPVVSADTMREVQEICISQTGPNEAMMVENAGHGASVMALKAIGGHRRIQPGNHNAAPVIVVLAGHTQVGLYALAAARHLANRTCHVYALVSPREPAEGSLEAIQRKCAEFSGVRIVHSVEDLPAEDTMPVDLIMDGLMGSETSIASLRKDYETRQLLWDAMDWANGNKAPILSLDFPSGINADDGHPFHVMHYIQPKWTLCFGAPKQGCSSRSVTGELFLADIGIPIISWQKANVRRGKIPWGAEYILALEY